MYEYDVFEVLEVLKTYCQSKPSLLLAITIICFITVGVLWNYVKLQDRAIRAAEANKDKNKTAVSLDKTK